MANPDIVNLMATFNPDVDLKSIKSEDTIMSKTAKKDNIQMASSITGELKFMAILVEREYND